MSLLAGLVVAAVVDLGQKGTQIRLTVERSGSNALVEFVGGFGPHDLDLGIGERSSGAEGGRMNTDCDGGGCVDGGQLFGYAYSEGDNDPLTWPRSNPRS